MDRRTVTKGLIQAANSYWLKKGFSCTNEIAIARWGKRKVDVLAINLKTELVICEVKSCVADFATDNKWREYLEACNRLYFVFTEDTAEKLSKHFDEFRSLGCGVLTLCPTTGYLKCRVPAKFRPMTGPMQKHIVTRLAWRAGDVSKRNSRRSRVFLGDNNGTGEEQRNPRAEGPEGPRKKRARTSRTRTSGNRGSQTSP